MEPRDPDLLSSEEIGYMRESVYKLLFVVKDCFDIDITVCLD
jgi:hypothetical protein